MTLQKTMEYKPCPFCGSINIEYQNDTGLRDEHFWQWIECADCGAKCPDKETWNRRVKSADYVCGAWGSGTNKMKQKLKKLIKNFLPICHRRWCKIYASNRASFEQNIGYSECNCDYYERLAKKGRVTK